MSDSRARKEKRQTFFGFVRGNAQQEGDSGVEPHSSRDQAYQRLKQLYEISKTLATFEGPDRAFPIILTEVVKTFPIQSAVLIEKRGDQFHTTLWPTSGLRQEQIEITIEHARTSFASMVDTRSSQNAEVQRRPTIRNSQGEEFKTVLKKEGQDTFIFLPLVVDNLPVFGGLQLEGSLPVNEDDLHFVNAVSNMLAVALDRYRKAQGELSIRQRQIDAHSAQLTQSQEQVNDLETERELRERFVSTLSHDLRTPLTAAKMSAQLILRQSDKIENTLFLAGNIVSHIDRIDQMVSDLLDANRIRAGEKLPLNISPCDLTQIATETLLVLTAVHGERFVLKTDAKEILGQWDCRALQRVIENLISNAVKYGHHQKSITLSLSQTEREAQIVVHNQGVPISPEDQKGLFKQFRRTRSAHAGGQKGWGLGLALVSGIVEAHGGRVRVESDASHGTTFTVQIPKNSSPLS